jgi:hypothetical protein
MLDHCLSLSLILRVVAGLHHRRDADRRIITVFIATTREQRKRAVACRLASALAGLCRSARRSRDGQTILITVPQAWDHAHDLRFWVELRGFEPLAPSMRMRVGRDCNFNSGRGATGG